jgi:hypothetical protein
VEEKEAGGTTKRRKKKKKIKAVAATCSGSYLDTFSLQCVTPSPTLSPKSE